MLKLTYIIALLLLPAALWAQSNGCVDEFAKNPTYQCTFPFQPVCACDGNTYFNQCDAINHGGIVFNGTNMTSGVCGYAAMFLGQDARNKLVSMFFQFQTAGGDLTFLILNTYGNKMQQRFIRSSNDIPIQLDIDVAGYPPGVYFAYAYGGSFTKVIKFAVGGL